MLVTIAQSVSQLIPAIAVPEKPLSRQDKMIWTSLSICVYLALSSLRLPGSQQPQISPFNIYEAAIGARRGTLLELGVMPLILANIFTVTAIAWRVIDNSNPSQVAAIKRGFSLLISVTFSLTLAISGHFGSSVFGEYLGALLAFVTTVIASSVLGCFDEALATGYGFGNGLNLFMAFSVSEASLKSLIGALSDLATTGRVLPLFGVVGTCLTLAIIIYYSHYRVEVPIKSLRIRGQSGHLHIRLLDQFAFPLMAVIGLAGVGYFTLYVGRILLLKVADIAITFKTAAFLVQSAADALVTYSNDGASINGGLGYLLSPPRALHVLLPIPLVVYSGAVMAVIAATCVFGVEHSSSSSKEVYKHLKKDHMTIQGYRDVSVVPVLDRYIQPAAKAGGLVLGVAAVVGDAFGAAGSGAGVAFTTLVVLGLLAMTMRDYSDLMAMIK